MHELAVKMRPSTRFYGLWLGSNKLLKNQKLYYGPSFTYTPTIRPDFERTIPIFRAFFHSIWPKSHQKLKTESTILFVFFSRSTVFRDENHKIRDRFKVKIFFFFLEMKIMKFETDLK